LTNHSDDSTGTHDYLARWSVAMQNRESTTASVLDEALPAATKENNTEQISFYTNLKDYTDKIALALSSHQERNIVTKYCSMCGKGKADGCILVAGGECVICDECIKICVGVVDTQRREKGIEYECSFCCKKQSEVSKIIAGPGVSICDSCVKICTEILARDSD
jgi:hypothetical protein